MSKIILYTAGTLGDHLPFFALTRALQSRGHEVCLALNASMVDAAQRAGVPSFALSSVEGGQAEAQREAWAWNFWDHSRRRQTPAPMSREKSERYLAQCRELSLLCREADLLIATSIRHQGFIAARASGVPWITVSLNPSAFYHPSGADQASFLAEYRRSEANILPVLQLLGAVRPMPAAARGAFWAPDVLLASSRLFFQPDLRPYQTAHQVDLTGFWYYQDPSWQDWQPDEDLRRFCEPGERNLRPLVLAFSSQPLEEPRRVVELHARAAASLGRRLMIQRGWAGFSEADLPPEIDPAQVLFADFLPHDWVFERAAAVIQHGGMGSIARALFHGCPLLIEPFGNDQLFNARQVQALGAGLSLHPFKATREEVTRALENLLSNPAIHNQARVLAARLQAEDGLAHACQRIEEILSRPRPAGRAAWRSPAGLLLQSPSPDSLTEVPPPMTPIPRLFHQTWKDLNVPPELLAFQQTWKERHPDWQFFLWTDIDNRELIRRHYAWFLPVYDSYPEAIQRADAARYFILHHSGGVYLDLDFECLRPLDALLAGRQFVLGLEPAVHLESEMVRLEGLTELVGNALIASTPGHPFWEHVFKQLVASAAFPGPLVSTGPIMLTRAVQSYPARGQLVLEPAEHLYPVDNLHPWDQLPEEARRQVLASAYAIHHWRGSWWHAAQAKPDLDPIVVQQWLKGQSVARFYLPLERYLGLQNQVVPLPRVSCLMVTHNRPALAQRAVDCFLKQTYPERELVIVDDSADDTLEKWAAGLQDPRLNFVRLAPGGQTLGELRNLAVERAAGEFVAQWDDDDLSDPQRLEIQMAVVQLLKADACLLERQTLWWPGLERLAISTARRWEGSFICRKSRMPRYPALRQGEDTPVIEEIFRFEQVVTLDAPGLYLYTFHGANTFTPEHWEDLWLSATASFEGAAYHACLARMSQRLGMDLNQQPASQQPEEQAAAALSPAPLPAPAIVVSPPPAGPPPRVLVLCPLKNAAACLPRFVENLKTLTYPHASLSLAFLESDSSDGTYAALQQLLPALEKEYGRVRLFKKDYAYQPPGQRWDPAQQFQRRSVLARSRNYLLALALEDEDWVLWMDSDLARYPADLVEKLLESNKEIVTPNCLTLGSEHPFDLNSYKLKPEARQIDWRPYLLDGILNPPPGLGRWYLNDLRPEQCVVLDGLGAAVLLVKADLHREGLIFPAYAYKYLIESEGLAAMARDMGYQCWGLPGLLVYHPGA